MIRQPIGLFTALCTKHCHNLSRKGLCGCVIAFEKVYDLLAGPLRAGEELKQCDGRMTVRKIYNHIPISSEPIGATDKMNGGEGAFVQCSPMSMEAQWA